MRDPAPFFGWYRQSKRHRWLKLAEADDYGHALNQLLDAAARLPGHAELLVSQIDPNKDRKTEALR
jgi:hypothetical protein